MEVSQERIQHLENLIKTHQTRSSGPLDTRPGKPALQGEPLLTVALFDDVGVVGFDDGLGVETPRRVGPGGAVVVMMAG